MTEDEGLPVIKSESNFAIVPIGLIASGLSDRAFRVYACLKSYSRPGYATFPKLETVAAAFNLSESYLQRGITELKKAGAIEVHKIEYGQGMRRKNQYVFPNIGDQFEAVKSDGSVDSPSDPTPPQPSEPTVPNPSNLTGPKEVEKEQVEKGEVKDLLPVAPLTDEEKHQLLAIDKLTSLLAWWVAKNTGGTEKPVGQRWKQACRRMIELDGRDPREMWKVLNWCQQDEFWQANVQSFDTFRKQYGKLVLKWKQSSANGNQTRKLTNAEQGLALIQRMEEEESKGSAQAALLGIESLGTTNEQQGSIEGTDLRLELGWTAGIAGDSGDMGTWPPSMGDS